MTTLTKSMDTFPERIPDFFSGRSVFITGASGFIGKVLVEKLLRSCPQIDKIYIILRGRGQTTPQERWNDLTKLEMFDRIKSERPGILENKVHVLEGDIKKIRFGLSQDEYSMLQEKVSVIFHVAASVRFNEPLPVAVMSNTRATREIVNMALGMKNLKVLNHISTTFCNCDHREVNEAIYPPPADWKSTINIAEILDPRTVAILSTKYLGVFPNTYTFTKNLAEQVIWDHRDQLPVVICRPSIVISSWKEPIPGWVDNLNGPIGVLIGVGKGVVRITYADKTIKSDYMAVDVAVKSMIVASWKRALISSSEDNIDIYNIASTSKSVTHTELMALADIMIQNYAMHEMIWYPSCETTKYRSWYRINAVFKHFLPAIFVDILLKMVGREPMLLQTQQKIHNAMMALGHFMKTRWLFHNENFLQLNNFILPEDKEDFDYDFSAVNALEYFEMCIGAAKRFLLHEDENKQKLVNKRVVWYYWVDRITSALTKLFVIWLLYKCVF